MATYNYAAMIEQAKEEGFSTELLPPGEYDAEVTHANANPTKKGGDQLSLRWKVLNGPSAGEGVWQNINFPEVDAAGKATNPKAVPPWLRKITGIGLDPATLGDLTAAANSRIGMVKRIAVSHSKGDSKTFTEVTVKGEVAGAAGVPAPPVAAPAAPPAQPPVQPPAPAAAPAPEPEEDEVTKLRRQLAEAQAAAEVNATPQQPGEAVAAAPAGDLPPRPF